MSEWYYRDDEQSYPPVSAEELQEMLDYGDVSPDIEVWTQGWEEWCPIADVEGFVLHGAPPQAYALAPPMHVDTLPVEGQPPALRDELESAAPAWTEPVPSPAEDDTVTPVGPRPSAVVIGAVSPGRPQQTLIETSLITPTVLPNGRSLIMGGLATYMGVLLIDVLVFWGVAGFSFLPMVMIVAQVVVAAPLVAMQVAQRRDPYEWVYACLLTALVVVLSLSGLLGLPSPSNGGTSALAHWRAINGVLIMAALALLLGAWLNRDVTNAQQD